LQCAALAACESASHSLHRRTFMKSLILWACGVPITVIIGLKIFGIL
jgi:hypothetical protein